MTNSVRRSSLPNEIVVPAREGAAPQPPPISINVTSHAPHAPQPCPFDACDYDPFAPQAPQVTCEGCEKENAMKDTALVEELRNALYKVANCDRQIYVEERELVAHETELRLEAAANGKNDTERKASGESAIANDVDCIAIGGAINGLRHERAYALADAEATKYALRLRIAFAGREEVPE